MPCLSRIKWRLPVAVVRRALVAGTAAKEASIELRKKDKLSMSSDLISDPPNDKKIDPPAKGVWFLRQAED